MPTVVLPGVRRNLASAAGSSLTNRWLLILLVLFLHLLPLTRFGIAPPFSQSVFKSPVIDPAPGTTPLLQEEFVNPGSALPMSHVASICELPDGRLAAAWYAGSHEGARDVAIFLATRSPGDSAWSEPRAIMTRELAERDLGRRIKKVANPVLFADASGGLWLLYVTITVGGWSGSSLNLTRSADYGLLWSPSRRFTLNPFFNMGELVRNRPVSLSDGSWLVPIYQELAGRCAELLWLKDPALQVGAIKTRIQGGRTGYQPSLVPINDKTALAFDRDFSQRQRISVARTDDAARTWSDARVLDLPNPDSGLSGIRLADGRIILIFNDSTTKRDNLRLAVSRDDGQTWTRIATLAEEGGRGVAYPFVIQTRDGLIHVVYTWTASAIKHIVFNKAWLDERQHLATK